VASDPRPPTPEEIRAAFGVEIGELRRHGVGWESIGWTDGTWFVKVWHDAPPTNLAVLEQLVLPVPIPVARPTVDGAGSAVTSDGRPYALFPFFSGRHATADDWRETARVLRLVHEHPLVDAPPVPLAEPCVGLLRDRLDHPWISDRRAEVEEFVDRLESVIERAAASTPPTVLVHTDFGGWNLLLDAAGRATAILDWDQAGVGPREHDVWIAFEHTDPVAFLTAYGAKELDATHLEYTLLRRAVQDLTARIVANTDREGIEAWGFARWQRLDADLARAAPFFRR
jgi:aminoglycoside phosphotransferase (APT) family kinase protein